MISLRLSRVACSVEIVRNGYGARINRTNARRAAQWQKLRQHFRYQGFIKGAQRCSGENNGDNCETDWHPDLQYLARTSPFSREASNPYASFCFRYGCICRLHDFEIGLPPRVRFRGAVVIFMFAFPVAALHFSARNPRLLGQWCPSLSRVSEGCRHKRPYTLHRTALLWSNRHGVWGRTSSTERKSAGRPYAADIGLGTERQCSAR